MSIGRNSGNSRNGKSRKTLQSTEGELDTEGPRDRNASFEPQFVRKHQRRLGQRDDKIIALYVRELSTEEAARSTLAGFRKQDRSCNSVGGG